MLGCFCFWWEFCWGCFGFVLCLVLDLFCVVCLVVWCGFWVLVVVGVFDLGFSLFVDGVLFGLGFFVWLGCVGLRCFLGLGFNVCWLCLIGGDCIWFLGLLGWVMFGLYCLWLLVFVCFGLGWFCVWV